MKAVPCPIESSELRRLYEEEHLTDEAIVARLGGSTTVKRVRSWRHRFGIETLARTARVEVPPIEGQLRSLLVGSMLGDGRLSRTVNASRYHENHCEAQKDYLLWKAEQWGSWVKEGAKPDFPGWRFNTVSQPSLNEWHSRFYDATGPKRLDRSIISLVDEFALAVWFMDDGSAGWWPCITFGMDPMSQGIAMAILLEHGFRPRWDVCKGNTGNFIFEGEDQAHRFIEIVRKHIPECMSSKLKFGFQGPHYQVRQALTEDILRDMSSKGVSIRAMALELGQSHTTIARYLTQYNIAHPRTVGRPKRQT
jgi:LAGLIDADG DNA endonuclease family